MYLALISNDKSIKTVQYSTRNNYKILISSLFLG